MSEKMGHSIDFDSRTIERPTIWMLEYSDECVEYYAQPQKVAVSLPDKNGRPRPQKLTLDFMEVNKEEVPCLIECKLVKDLEKLAEANPHRWVKGLDGKWDSPPLRKELKQLGLEFKLMTDEDLHPNLIANLEYLSSTPIAPDAKPIALHHKIAKAVSNGPKSLKEICDNIGCSVSSILEALQLGCVHIDLENELLARPDLTRVFASRYVAMAYGLSEMTRIPIKGAASIAEGDKLDWDGIYFEVKQVGKTKLMLQKYGTKGSLRELGRSEVNTLLAQHSIVLHKLSNKQETDDTIKQLIHKAPPQTLAKACYKLGCVKKIQKPKNKESTRTIQRWQQKAKRSERLFGNDFVLFLEPTFQGDHRKRLNVEVYDAMKEVMDDFYLSKQAPTLAQAHRELKAICEERGITAPSRNTLDKYIHDNSGDAQRLKERLSSKAAYAITTGSGLNFDPHYLGEYAMHRAHIDNKQIKIQCRCPRTGAVLGKAWLTLICLPKIRYYAGYALSFEAPSARTTLLAFRDVYRKMQALPSEVIADNGKEFKNLALHELLAAFGTNLTFCPPHAPRNKAILERFNRHLDDMLLKTMSGSTHAISRKTGITKENNPELRSCWDLGSLDQAIRGFLEVYNDQPQEVLEWKSPKQALEEDQSYHPLGNDTDQMLLPPEACEILFLPNTPKDSLKIQAGRGVIFSHHTYWCDEIAAHRGKAKDLNAKYDPYDLTHIYLYINGEWCEAKVRSGPLREILHLLTEWERLYISREMVALGMLSKGKTKKTSLAYGRYARKIRSMEAGLKANLKSVQNKELESKNPHNSDELGENSTAPKPGKGPALPTIDRTQVKLANVERVSA
jgi:hypothetical protein